MGFVCDSLLSCEDWIEGMFQIEAAHIFCANRIAAPKYTAKPFKYCPWCGEEINRNKPADDAAWRQKK